MEKYENKYIERLQNNLGVIRKVAGWTTQQLADEVGVTRQTISNLEKVHTPMTKIQYLAFRTVLNYEIARESNDALATVVQVLVDFPLEYTDMEAGSDISEISVLEEKPSSSFESLRAITSVLAAGFNPLVLTTIAPALLALAASMASTQEQKDN